MLEFVIGTSTRSPVSLFGAPIPPNQIKYLDLLAWYYVLKRQHVSPRLAKKRSMDAGGVPTLEQQRHQYLSNAVLQAKNASNSDSLVGSVQGTSDNGLLNLLEGKLTVLRFQIKIKERTGGYSFQAVLLKLVQP
ncbi:hypothetical protein VitviT2T_004126 [Vitis vinifera]|uniref:Uncharacterized protein n=2 Tax=Vitis vinifera TaxID=29760 RepID=A0ABY9BP38_VITVI|nr:hypothetical protein VitviT2T_004126 [Vitis vinifera]